MSLQVELANAISEWLEAPEVLPILWDEDTRRWFVDEDGAVEVARVIEIGPETSTYAPSLSRRSTTDRNERAEWSWRAVVMFDQTVDRTAYEDALRTPIFVKPEEGETYPAFRVEVDECEPTEAPAGSEGQGTHLVLRLRANSGRS